MNKFFSTAFTTLFTLCILATNSVSAAEFIRLGIPQGAERSWARSVSDDGLVISGMIFTSGEQPQTEVFRWTKNTGIIGLGFLPGDDRSRQLSGQQVSGDGSTIIGLSGATNGFIYNEEDGLQSLGLSGLVDAVSFDGSVVVGESGFSPFRWTPTEGILDLGHLPGKNGGHATAVSADGTIVVGISFRFDDSAAFRWTEQSGMSDLGISGVTSVTALSPDGTVVGGRAFLSSETNQEAFRWTANNGARALGWLPGSGNDDGSNFSTVRSFNRDGSISVGFSGNGDRRKAFLWTEKNGMQDLQQLLIDQYDLGASLEGWRLTSGQDISANGDFIVGVGVNPDGAQEGWMVRLANVPEPGGMTMMIAGSMLLCLRRRRTMN